MDQLMVDVGDQSVVIGDEVVLIGTQGLDSVTANELAMKSFAASRTVSRVTTVRLSG
jgi:alanine racemase